MKKLLVIVLAIFLVSAVSLPICTGEKTPTEIRIGGADSDTGIFAFFSNGGKIGVKAAIEDINSLGGIYIKEAAKKLPVRYISTNNESDATKAGTLARSMIARDNLHAMIQGVNICIIAAPVSNVCERYKIPFVCASGPGEPWLAIRETVKPPWEYTWCISFMIASPPPKGSVWDRPGMTLADSTRMWLESIIDRTNRIAGMYATDDPNGRGWYQIFPKIAERVGFEVVGLKDKVGLFAPGTKDFSSVIQKWKNSNVEVLLGNAPPDDSGALLRQVWGMGFKPKAIMAGQAGIAYENVVAFGGNIPNGLVVDRWWYPSFDPAACPGIAGRTPKSLAKYWVEQTGEPLNPAVGLGYMTGQVLLDAIERAGTLDGPTINAAVAKTHVDTIHYSPIAFDENHFARYADALGQWRRTDAPEKWECVLVVAPLPYMGKPEKQIFPIPYD